jgi:hypothetical protein
MTWLSDAESDRCRQTISAEKSNQWTSPQDDGQESNVKREGGAQPHASDIISPGELDTAPSDSGYYSGRAESICSIDSTGSSLGLPSDFLHDFIAFFADTLSKTAGASQWAQYALSQQSAEKIEKHVTALLKDFTLGNESPFTAPSASKSQERRVIDCATRLVRSYRPKIARCFLDHVVPEPDRTVSLANRLQGLGQHLSLMERLGLLEKGDTTDANIRGEPSGQLHVDEEDDEELLAALTSIQDILIYSDSFQQLASELRKSLYRDSGQEMELIRDCVTDELPLGSPYSTTFDVDWNLLEFIHTQYDGIVSLASTVTITGSAFYAQATTCGEYVRKN